MQAHIKKWGNSLGMRIPSQITQKLQITDGSCVELLLEEGRLVISPKKYDLDALLLGITPENLHQEEWQEEDSVGNEAW